MTDFDRDDEVHNKKLKLAFLAILAAATITMMVLDCLDYFEKWGG